MPKFRKRPVVIEAFCWKPGMELPTGFESLNPTYAYSSWVQEAGFSRPSGFPSELHIKTLEGTMAALPGDWIIKGVKGEFYPCKPDIFEATYESAESGGDSKP